MSRWLFLQLNPVLFILITHLLMILETVVFKQGVFHYFEPKLMIFFVLWCALKRSLLEGGILVLLIGVLTELSSSAPKGFYVLVGMYTYLVLRFLWRWIVFQGESGKFKLVALSSVLFWIIEWTTLELMPQIEIQLWSRVLNLVSSTLVNLALTPMIFLFLERFDWITYKDPRAGRSTDDDQPIIGEGL